MEIIDKRYLCIKYDMQFEGFQRNYKIPLDAEFHNLECTTPISLYFNKITINERAWNKLIEKVAIYLCENYNYVDFLSFTPSWKDYNPFNSVPLSNQWKKITDKLFLYINFFSDHSYRFIVELIQYVGINLSDGYLIIHRSPYAEPEEVREMFSEHVKELFRHYLLYDKLYSNEKCDKIIKNIQITMNKLLTRISKSYNDWFLFTDMQRLTNYSKKFQEFITSRTNYSEKAINQMNRYISLLNEFYHKYFYGNL